MLLPFSSCACFFLFGPEGCETQMKMMKYEVQIASLTAACVSGGLERGDPLGGGDASVCRRGGRLRLKWLHPGSRGKEAPPRRSHHHSAAFQGHCCD